MEKIVYTVVILLSVVTRSQSVAILKTLKDELFNNRDYDSLIPPQLDPKVPITVYLTFHLNGINVLDEVEEKLTTTGFLELTWTDKNLTWNPSDYSGIETFNMPQNLVWKPDLTLQNGFTKLTELGDDVILVQIRYDGVILWKPYEVFETICYIDIVNFPFDSQSCQLIFGAWATPNEVTSFDLGSDKVALQAFKPNALWDMVSSEVRLSVSLIDVHQIEVSLDLKRKPQYYLLTIICPILFLSILAVFTFIIPVESGEKISYSMTVYLAFAVFLTIVSSSLPVNSQTTSYLSAYLLALLSLGTLIVMVTVIQVRLHNHLHSETAPSCVQCFIRLTRRMTCFHVKLKIAPQPDSLPQHSVSCQSQNPTSSSFLDVRTKDIPTINSQQSKDNEEVKSGTECRQMEPGQSFPVYPCDKEAEVLTWADFVAALDLFFFCLFSFLTTLAACLTMFLSINL